LPQNFAQQTARINQFQAFFDALDNDPVFAQVRVLKVDPALVTLALPSATLANYLRLYSRDIQQQLADSFHQHYALNVVASPEAFYQRQQESGLAPAKKVSKSMCDRIKASAETIEDDEVRRSLLSLARSMQR
jgi:hypothetical protein